MSARLLLQRQFRSAILIIVSIFIFILLISIESSSYFKCSLCQNLNLTSTRKSFLKIFNNTKDEETSIDMYSILCLHMANRLDNEQISFQSSVIHQSPSINSSRLHRLPYYYSKWKYSSLLSRRFTPCEHNLVMHLLMIIERICRKHQITFMLSDGTLLGSLRHHDIIPWDDDVDIMIASDDQIRFTNIIKEMNETLVQYHVLTNEKRKREYYKIFFKNTPSAGRYSWNFPFIDVFFYIKNETHLWKMGEPETLIENKYIFPLIMRPLGELWLPAPRQPEKLIDFDPFDECRTHFWDHRIERGQKEISQKCQVMKDFYPFVERDNQSNSTEILKLNHTIIHTIIYD